MIESGTNLKVISNEVTCDWRFVSKAIGLSSKAYGKNSCHKKKLPIKLTTCLKKWPRVPSDISRWCKMIIAEMLCLNSLVAILVRQIGLLVKHGEILAKHFFMKPWCNGCFRRVCYWVVKQKNSLNDILKAVFWNFSDPGEIRTLDPMIKSHLLYQLSYGVICANFCRVANMQIIFFFSRLNYS